MCQQIGVDLVAESLVGVGLAAAGEGEGGEDAAVIANGRGVLR
jgi:hypothetical protein